MRDDYDRTDRRDPRDDRRPRPARRDYDRPRGSGDGGPLGVIALVMGVVALVASVVPCVGALAIPVGAFALVLAIASLLIARHNGQSMGVPVAGVFVGGAAVAFSLLWIALFSAMIGGEDRSARRPPAPPTVVPPGPVPPAPPPAVRPNPAAKKAPEPALTDEQFEKKLLEDLAKDRVKEAIRNGPGLPVTAAALEADFATNVVAADLKYKDKVLAVTGQVVRVVRDESKAVYTLELATDDGAKAVACDFAERAKHPLASAARGQEVTVRGQCLGRVGEVVRLKDCVVVK